MKLNELYKFVKNGVLKTEILKYFSSVQIIEIMKSDHRPGDALSRILFDKDGMECIKNHYEYYIAVKFSQKIENEILTAFLNDNYSLLNWGDYYINVYGKDLAGFHRCFVFNGTEDQKMDDIQERLEHYEAKDRERKEREAEIMRIDLQLFVYARKQRYTLGDKFYRKFALRNAMILDYGKTYGTEAQERLRERLDDARTNYECMDSHDKRIIEEIFKIVSNYNLTENTGEE